MKKIFHFTIVAFIIFGLIAPKHSNAQLFLIRSIVFPVAGKVSYSDDFGVPRSGGRTHEGNDIFAKKMTPLIAAVEGVISFVPYPEPSYGYTVTIKDNEGLSIIICILIMILPVLPIIREGDILLMHRISYRDQKWFADS